MTNDTVDVHSSRLEKNGLLIWLILAGALLIRLIHFLLVKNTDLVDILIIDSQFYHQWAVAISQGQIIGDKIFFMSPLYSYFMGLIYAVTGAAPALIIVLQSLLSVFTVWLVYRLAKRIAGVSTGLIAALSAAVYAPFIFYDSTILTSSLILFLSALILNFMADLLEREKTGDLWKLGIIIGLSALARPLVLIFMPFVFFALLQNNRATWVKRSGILTIAILLALSPVAVRNLIVGGELTLTTSSAGMNFYVGNNEDATGLYWEAPFLASVEPGYEDEDYRRIASEAVERELTTREAGGYWMRKGLDWMINNPLDYIKLVGKKTFYFWSRAEFANNVSYYMGKEASPLLRYNPFGFWLICPLGLAGLILLWRKSGWKKVSLLWLWIAAYFVGALLFFVASEYRLPILLALHVGAGYFIVELINRLRQGKAEPVMRLIVLMLIFMPLVNLRTDFIRRGENARMDYFNYGNTLLVQNKFTEAGKRFERALEIDPYFAEGMLKLADAYYRAGEREKAIEVGKRVGLEDPETILTIVRGDAVREGYALLEEGKLTDAMNEFTTGGMDPSEAEAETLRVSRLIRAQKAYQLGEKEKTIQLFKEVRQSDKTLDPSISYNIALLLWQDGEIDSAEFYASEALRADSMNVPSVYLLARIYNASDRREEAEKLMNRVNPDADQQKQLLATVRMEMDSLGRLGEHLKVLQAYSRYGKLGFDIDPEDKFRIGVAQIEVGNVDVGLRLLQETEEEFQFESDLFFHQGRAFVKMGRISEALEMFGKAVSLDPQSIPPRIALARHYMTVNKIDRAWRELSAVEHLDILDPGLSMEYKALMDTIKSKI